jgi:hypothetical protein
MFIMFAYERKTPKERVVFVIPVKRNVKLRKCAKDLRLYCRIYRNRTCNRQACYVKTFFCDSRKNPRNYFASSIYETEKQTSVSLLQTLFHECIRKSGGAKPQFTIKKRSSFKAFEYLNKEGEEGE